MNKIDYNILQLGDVTLLSGEILLNAKLAYKTYGSLNQDKSNVILLPTFYTGTHERNEGFFGVNRAINPKKHLTPERPHPIDCQWFTVRQRKKN